MQDGKLEITILLRYGQGKMMHRFSAAREPECFNLCHEIFFRNFFACFKAIGKFAGGGSPKKNVFSRGRNGSAKQNTALVFQLFFRISDRM